MACCAGAPGTLPPWHDCTDALRRSDDAIPGINEPADATYTGGCSEADESVEHDAAPGESTAHAIQMFCKLVDASRTRHEKNHKGAVRSTIDAMVLDDLGIVSTYWENACGNKENATPLNSRQRKSKQALITGACAALPHWRIECCTPVLTLIQTLPPCSPHVPQHWKRGRQT